MNDNSKLERNLSLLLVMRVLLCSFAFDMPVIVLLWQQCGLSLAEIMLLQSLFAVAIAAAEVPSGYFADLVGRRLSLVAGAALLCSGAAFYVLAESFGGFLVAELLLALGFAFMSGSDQALFYDTLLALGRSNESTKRWGQMQSVMFGFSAVAGILGGFIGSYDLRLPLVLTLAGTLVLVGAARMLVEPERELGEERCRSGLGELITLAVETMLRNRRTRWLMVYPAVILAVSQAGLWLYQPYLLLSGVPVAYFGVIFALFNVTAAVAARRVKGGAEGRVEGEWSAAVFAILAVAVSYVLLGNVVTLFSCLFILLQQWVRGYMSVAFTDGLNREVGSERRATLLSLQSMLQRLVYAVLIVPLGTYADAHGVLSTLTLLSVIAIVGGGATLALFRCGNRG